MIKVNELKIGNWFYVNGSQEQVVELSSLPAPEINGMDENLIGQASPIPITPKLLIACGFVKDAADSGSEWHKISYFTDCKESAEMMWIFLNANGGRCAISDDDSTGPPAMTGKIITSLHQLQNLYYSLTGQELEYKP